MKVDGKMALSEEIKSNRNGYYVVNTYGFYYYLNIINIIVKK